MDPRNDPNLSPPQVDETRRRLAKASLAAPAVLGALASRPVLGASLHHCTPSGHISGFASPNPGATPPCSRLDHTPSYYAASKSNWPGGISGPFLNSSGNSRQFPDAPSISGTFHGSRIRFKDAYQVRQLVNPFNVRTATVWDILKGCNVNETSERCAPNWVLEARPGFDPDIALGQEAIAAAMNALTGYPGSFPIPIQQVVEMFNKVVTLGGLYQVTSTNQWNAAEVKAYWQSLHA
jgi:hypothetical protein